MSHHLIDISAASCSITSQRGQLVCRADGAPERKLPMEDIGALIINSFSAQIHNRVFIEAAMCGTVIIFCERFRPVSLMLPAMRATETALTRAQVQLADKARRVLWMKAITAKCANQAAIVRAMLPLPAEADRITAVAAGKSPGKESASARLYWRALSNHLGQERFRRGDDNCPLNGLLNYGYTVLLARVLQKMLAVGLDPTFGIGHATRERATPLAYDLMEPFRVAVDARIVQWFNQGDQNTRLRVDQEFKKWVQGFLDMKAPYAGKRFGVQLLIEYTLQGFRQALLARRPALYKPWTIGSTKWDGCW